MPRTFNGNMPAFVVNPAPPKLSLSFSRPQFALFTDHVHLRELWSRDGNLCNRQYQASSLHRYSIPLSLSTESLDSALKIFIFHIRNRIKKQSLVSEINYLKYMGLERKTTVQTRSAFLSNLFRQTCSVPSGRMSSFFVKGGKRNADQVQ
jgi:hypothetical protein